MGTHEPSQEEWREVARQASQEKNPGKLIHLAHKIVENYDEEQRIKKPCSSFSGEGSSPDQSKMPVHQLINLEHGGDATQSMSLLAAHAAEQAREMLHAGVTREEILTMLVNAAEDVAGRGSAVCSILVLDKEGLLRNGASPNLPADYLAAIDGLKPNPSVGTCAAAAATGSVVVTDDFQADDKWAELRHLPQALGFTGAWSMPIKAADGTVLATLGTYFRSRRSPTPEEIRCVGVLAAAAGLVLEGQDKRM